ncbi:hypothetical protein EYF80_055614 [Liparis tanakae]|uniref:Uncharacterized protein n=1 Tax=Liparis tanakae TaxID=230148 RepID=A0A4Z2F164_9TELE|nr:hypothetical protein EYF80_055614 [Liparis tanakae]
MDKGSERNVRSEFARLLIDVKRRRRRRSGAARRGCPREPIELARGIFPFLSDEKTRQGALGGGGGVESSSSANSV